VSGSHNLNTFTQPVVFFAYSNRKIARMLV